MVGGRKPTSYGRVNHPGDIMKLQIMSDLHLEHHKDDGKSLIASLPERKDTTLILAGDITSLQSADYAREHLEALTEKYKRVLMVPGNHEFYGTNPVDAWNTLLIIGQQVQNLTVLTSNLPVEFEGKRFLGDTLWFKDNPTTQRWHKRQMNDFSVIKQFEPWVFHSCDQTIRDFEKHLKKDDILITHHLPSPRSVHPKWAADDLNRFFVCDIEQLIIDREPALAVHGHTHDKADYMIGPTRVLCNPMGYPRESTRGHFDEALIIEV